MTIAQIYMKHCPFCGSLDVDPQFSASQKKEDGSIEHGPGCMDCGATAETVKQWNSRADALPGELPIAGTMVDYRSDLSPALADEAA